MSDLYNKIGNIILDTGAEPMDAAAATDAILKAVFDDLTGNDPGPYLQGLFETWAEQHNIEVQDENN